jgi:hypothetical protein
VSAYRKRPGNRVVPAVRGLTTAPHKSALMFRGVMGDRCECCGRFYPGLDRSDMPQ